jgi:hypothetical protein
MNSTEYNYRRANGMGRLMKWPLLCGLLALASARPALAADALYENDGIVNYPLYVSSPPVIDATNFVNNNQFIINFTALSDVQPFYETSDTLNYTNIGVMMANTGFQFDNQSSVTGLRTMSASFYNSGMVSCGSITDTTASIIFGSPYDQCFINATNILNPGTVDVGEDGMIQLAGQNVDLTRSRLTVEGGGANAFGTGTFGLNVSSFTNNNVIYTLTPPWDPSIYLGANFAYSGIFPIQPIQLVLNNSTAYFNFASSGTNLNIIRSVFIQDTSSTNVTYNVYFDSAGVGVGGGNATIEWVGSYLNAANGNYYSNYLYLNDNYILGASTNVVLGPGGYPDNFTFTESPVKLIFQPPAPAGFYDVFPSGAVTNLYAFANVQLFPTTESTNQIANHSITNLPGRLQIGATKELNMALAQITGLNYMSVQSTNQFDGSPGASIQSPYSDLNLGVTNGSPTLTISNLLAPAVPVWSGPVQAWSTRWLALSSNTLDGTNFFTVTNDFRVLIVGSQLTPTTLAQVQDLIMHSTNSIVISDALNVMRTFTADPQNLTLTTNGPGNGATSLDGELNIGSANIFLASSLPNLRNLTNNGAIRTANLAVFGSSSSIYGAFINNGLITDQGTTIYATNFLSSGIISNGVAGSFNLQSAITTLTNGSITAGGDISITTGSLLASNVVIVAGRSLTLAVTNSLTDTGPSPTNGNIWTLGSSSSGSGFNLPAKPSVGDLLGTTITNIGPVNRNVVNTWAATDFGVSTAGYTNNAAVGRLILDANGPGTLFTFNGTGASNAIYVDQLTLLDYASYTNHDINGNIPAISFNTNLVVYYADAIASGVDVSEKLNHKNGNRLRWMASYAGYYSSTKIVYPDGTTNSINVALARSTDLDSDGDGVDNANDLTPIFTPDEVNFTVAVTNIPPLTARLTWQTIPDATNTVFYRTNLTMTGWLTLTNFVTPPAPPHAPITTNVLDTVNPAFPKFYRVLVNPNSTDFSGP